MYPDNCHHLHRKQCFRCRIKTPLHKWWLGALVQDCNNSIANGLDLLQSWFIASYKSQICKKKKKDIKSKSMSSYTLLTPGIIYPVGLFKTS